MIQKYDIVKCDDFSGLWLVTDIKKGNAFVTNTYAFLTYVLDDDFNVPIRTSFVKCKIECCYLVPSSKLYDKIFRLNTTLSKIKKINMTLVKAAIISASLFIIGVIIQANTSYTATSISNMTTLDYTYLSFYVAGITFIPAYSGIKRLISKIKTK